MLTGRLVLPFPAHGQLHWRPNLSTDLGSAETQEGKIGVKIVHHGLA